MTRLFVKKFQRFIIARVVKARLNRLKHTKQEMTKIEFTFFVPSCFLTSNREQSQKTRQENYKEQDEEGNIEG